LSSRLGQPHFRACDRPQGTIKKSFDIFKYMFKMLHVGAGVKPSVSAGALTSARREMNLLTTGSLDGGAPARTHVGLIDAKQTKAQSGA
jgi:hypothetical protein